MTLPLVAPPDGVPSLLIVLTLAVPAAMLLACLGRGARAAMPRFLALAPLPALAAALLVPADAAIVLDPGRLGLTLGLDGPRSLLLGVTALLWSAAGGYAGRYLADDPHAPRFAVTWLLSLIGCLGVFLAKDLASFYLLFAVVSIAAYGLVVHDGTPAARRAAAIYLSLAIAGEACLLIAFVLLAAATPGESLRIADVVASLPDSPHRTQTFVFLLLGFGLKAGLVPLHGWLPLAHPAAPMPASAVLSGAIIKTGILGLIVFLPAGIALPGWGEALVAIGLATALYGAALGWTQANPKTILAYSSVSQMGVITAIVGAGIAASDQGAAMIASFYAIHHALVKGGLFLGIGVIAATARRGVVLAAMAVLALSLAGLPLTSGALAKLASKPLLSGDVVGPLTILSSIASGLLMIHFLRRLAMVAAPAEPGLAPFGLRLPWWILTIGSVALPWALFRFGTDLAPADVLTAKALWSATWPILLAAAASLVVLPLVARLPPTPEGDLLGFGERLMRAIYARGGVVDPLDRVAREWPVAGAAMLLIVGGLAVAFWLGLRGGG